MVPVRNVMSSKQNRQFGFTLMELMVAVAIFSTLLVMVGGIFVFAVRLQARAFNQRKMQENVQFILESMARELRVADCISSDPLCASSQRTSDNDCAVSNSSLVFQHPLNGSVRYFLQNQQVMRQVGAIVTQLSSSDVQFTRLNFCIDHNSASDNAQSRVTIIMAAQAGSGRELESMQVQTSLSLRFLND